MTRSAGLETHAKKNITLYDLCSNLLVQKSPLSLMNNLNTMIECV